MFAEIDPYRLLPTWSPPWMGHLLDCCLVGLAVSAAALVAAVLISRLR